MTNKQIHFERSYKVFFTTRARRTSYVFIPREKHDTTTSLFDVILPVASVILWNSMDACAPFTFPDPNIMWTDSLYAEEMDNSLHCKCPMLTFNKCKCTNYYEHRLLSCLFEFTNVVLFGLLGISLILWRLFETNPPCILFIIYF